MIMIALIMMTTRLIVTGIGVEIEYYAQSKLGASWKEHPPSLLQVHHEGTVKWE
jgi:hypothetical protein